MICCDRVSDIESKRFVSSRLLVKMRATCLSLERQSPLSTSSSHHQAPRSTWFPFHPDAQQKHGRCEFYSQTLRFPMVTHFAKSADATQTPRSIREVRECVVFHHRFGRQYGVGSPHGRTSKGRKSEERGEEDRGEKATGEQVTREQGSKSKGSKSKGSKSKGSKSKGSKSKGLQHEMPSDPLDPLQVRR